MSWNYRLIVADSCPLSENLMFLKSADSSATETLHCLNSACPGKLPRWIVLVCEFFCKHAGL